MSSSNTQIAQPNNSDFDTIHYAKLLVDTLRHCSSLQRGPRGLKAAWEKTSTTLQNEEDESTSTLFARLGFQVWCVFFIVKNDSHGQKNFQGKADCQNLFDKLDDVSMEDQVALANAVSSTIDEPLQKKINELYEFRIKDTASLQPAAKRQRKDSLHIRAKSDLL